VWSGSSLVATSRSPRPSLLQRRGVFLIAPALYMQGLPELRASVLDCPAAVVHGWRDDLVALRARVRFAQAYRAALPFCWKAITACTIRIRVIQYLFEYFLIALDLPRSPSGVALSALADRSAASASTRCGTVSRGQRPSRPRAEVISIRRRRRMAATIQLRAVLPVMIYAPPAWGFGRAAGPSAPTARR